MKSQKYNETRIKFPMILKYAKGVRTIFDLNFGLTDFQSRSFNRELFNDILFSISYLSRHKFVLC